MNGKSRRALRVVATRLKSNGTLATVSLPADPSEGFIIDLQKKLSHHELVLVRFPNVEKKREVKIFVAEKLMPALTSGEGRVATELIQVLGHTALLYSKHLTRPKWSKELAQR